MPKLLPSIQPKVGQAKSNASQVGEAVEKVRQPECLTQSNNTFGHSDGWQNSKQSIVDAFDVIANENEKTVDMLIVNSAAASVGLSHHRDDEGNIEFNKVEDLNKLNEIISELVEFTQDITSPSQAELRREQSQINWFLSHNDDTVVNENFDIDLFDNVLISNNDPMIGEIKLF